MKLNIAHYIVLSWTALVNAQEEPIPTVDDMSPDAKSRLQKFRNTDWSRFLQTDSETTTGDSLLQANECKSAVEDYAVSKIVEMGVNSYQTIRKMNLDFLIYTYKQFVDYNEDGEYFGPGGENTAQLQELYKNIKEFWGQCNKAGSQEIVTTNIKLLGAHGIDMADKYKLVQTLMLVYPSFDLTFYDAYAGLIQNFIETLPGKYANPILTLNAYAATNRMGTADVIIYGDGIIDFYNAIGIPEGPSHTLAHEFGHHLQFDLNTLIDLNGDNRYDPSETRRSELMCDAFAGYFLSHKKGAKFTKSMTLGIADAAYSTGDCGVDRPDHHGTPDQRKCATQWGASQANNAILYPDKFIQCFDRHLSRILRLDPSVCN